MPERHDIDNILKKFPFDPTEVTARTVKARDGRKVLQMRVEMGVLQMEMKGRPDGTRPEGCETYYDYLVTESFREGAAFRLSEAQCLEADREFVQYYHRRISWLRLREFRRAVEDADHSLAFMDFIQKYSPDEDWTLSHEQYRPYIIFHRSQAEAMAILEEQDGKPSGAERAIEALDEGLRRMKAFFVAYEVEDHFEEDDMVLRLENLKNNLRRHYHIDRTLPEQLADAVATEQYELAARLRDELKRRKRTR